MPHWKSFLFCDATFYAQRNLSPDNETIPLYITVEKSYATKALSKKSTIFFAEGFVLKGAVLEAVGFLCLGGSFGIVGD